jgi:hypothetical protein
MLAERWRPGRNAAVILPEIIVMKTIPVFLLIIFNVHVFAQQVNWKKLEQQQADKILLDPAAPPVKVLLLGTFHFAYPNLDQHRTDSSHMLDVMSARRQQEIRQLLNVLAAFRPTRIYIEETSQQYADSLYNAYLEGRYTLGRNETDQLAFRLSKELHLPRVYAVDASNYAYDKYGDLIDSLWNNRVPANPARDALMEQRYARLYNAGDSVQMENTIMESFLLMADRQTLRRMHGAYLTTGFNTVDNSGPDFLAMWWYNRNLRIFNNILKTKPAADDRIIVLFGNGHIPILKHCFEASPEFEVVELKRLFHCQEGTPGLFPGKIAGSDE